VCVLLDELADTIFGKSTRFGHTWNLQRCVRQADVRVETAPGGGDSVGGHKGVGRQAVCRAVIGDALGDGCDQVRRGRAEVAAAGTGGVVAVARCRGAWVKVARPGVGLGLAICSAIIEAHAGTIAASNRPQGGACVTFTLPLGEPPLIEEEVLHVSNESLS